jgi:hypothetical protein
LKIANDEPRRIATIIQKITLPIMVNASVNTDASVFMNEPEEEEGCKPSAQEGTDSSQEVQALIKNVPQIPN